MLKHTFGESNLLAKWLFSGGHGVGQFVIGKSSEDKSAIAWFPSPTKVQDDGAYTWALSQGELAGFTQMCFPNWKDIAGDGELCWFGIDIDDDKNSIDLIEWAEAQVNTGLSYRTSCGGKGIHAIGRLSHPVKCHKSKAKSIIASIAKPFVDAIEGQGINICRYNYMTFWLAGGKNKWISQTEDRINSEVIALETSLVENAGGLESLRAMECLDLPLKPIIKDWLRKLGCAGLVNTLGKTNAYLGNAVPLLRNLGEGVETKSTMRGNGQINSWFVVTSDSISLYSSPDGNKVIWCVKDEEELLNNFFE